MKPDFETQKANLLNDIRSVLNELETLYQDGAAQSQEEAQVLKARLSARLSEAQARLATLEDKTVEQVKIHAKRADEYVNEKPYYAMGFAALAGLVVGVLLNRR